MDDLFLLFIVLAIIPVATVILFFILWLVNGLAKAGAVSIGFLEWTKYELLEISRSTRARVAIINPFFHFIVLGLVIKPLFINDLPTGHWLLLIIMVMALDPIISYFYGWDMWFRSCVPADASKFERFIVFVVITALYVYLLLDWFGGMEGWTESGEVG